MINVGGGRGETILPTESRTKYIKQRASMTEDLRVRMSKENKGAEREQACALQKAPGGRL